MRLNEEARKIIEGKNAKKRKTEEGEERRREGKGREGQRCV